jgi:ketosteroid isomerase-like protein
MPLASACGGGAATRAEADTGVADDVRAAERQRLHALLTKDLDAALALHADDFELVNPLGETASKEAYIDSGAAFEYTAWRPISPMRVRVSGDLAVLRYKSEIEIHGSRGQFWHTDVYEKRGGKWQIVWSQTTALP